MWERLGSTPVGVKTVTENVYKISSYVLQSGRNSVSAPSFIGSGLVHKRLILCPPFAVSPRVGGSLSRRFSSCLCVRKLWFTLPLWPLLIHDSSFRHRDYFDISESVLLHSRLQLLSLIETVQIYIVITSVVSVAQRASKHELEDIFGSCQTKAKASLLRRPQSLRAAVQAISDCHSARTAERRAL